MKKHYMLPTIKEQAFNVINNEGQNRYDNRYYILALMCQNIILQIKKK